MTTRFFRLLVRLRCPEPIYYWLLDRLTDNNGWRPLFYRSPLADWERELICQRCGASCCGCADRMTAVGPEPVGEVDVLRSGRHVHTLDVTPGSVSVDSARSARVTQTSIDLTPDLTPGPDQCWECPIRDGRLVCDPTVSLRCPRREAAR